MTGLRDFAPFCKAREGATSIRDLQEFSWERPASGPDAGLLVATVRADAFCHSMVRSLVGAVLAVGQGRRDASWLADVSAGSTRSQAIAVAPFFIWELVVGLWMTFKGFDRSAPILSGSAAVPAPTTAAVTTPAGAA